MHKKVANYLVEECGIRSAMALSLVKRFKACVREDEKVCVIAGDILKEVSKTYFGGGEIPETWAGFDPSWGADPEPFVSSELDQFEEGRGWD